ncbi:MAG: heterocyst development glycosyltransferase HepC [Gloeotrichia echinulata IR180]|jgi:lipopolysaccharide/colanic/teichoic acid biosynthesis glycosyltransferase
MTLSIIPTLQNGYTVDEKHQDNRSPYCTLQWRRGQLLVKSSGKLKQPYLPALYSEQSLVECLKHSPINFVRIDPKLGEARLKFWADACEQANKSIFLGIPSTDKGLKPSSPLFSGLKRLIDWIFALALLLIVTPVMLGLVLLMRVYSPGSLFSREWYVGERGKFFRGIKFRTTAKQNITSLGGWMAKYELQNLPQLFNVVRGDMSLIGSRCWTLEDAVRLSSEEQKQLNQLSGMTGGWEVSPETNLLNLDGQTL